MHSTESGLCQITNASMKKKMEFINGTYLFILILNLFYDLGNNVTISIDKEEF